MAVTFRSEDGSDVRIRFLPFGGSALEDVSGTLIINGIEKGVTIISRSGGVRMLSFANPMHIKVPEGPFTLVIDSKEVCIVNVLSSY